MASTVTTKWVYSFGGGRAEGRADMRNLLGGKGANLAEMSNLGLPVPPGFTITTEVCTYFYAHEKSYPTELRDQVGESCVARKPCSDGIPVGSRLAYLLAAPQGRAQLLFSESYWCTPSETARTQASPSNWILLAE